MTNLFMASGISYRYSVRLAEFTRKVVALYGYSFAIPCRVIGSEVGLSHTTVRKYFATLERFGVVEIHTENNRNGTTYRYNKRRANILIKNGLSAIELGKILNLTI